MESDAEHERWRETENGEGGGGDTNVGMGDGRTWETTERVRAEGGREI